MRASTGLALATIGAGSVVAGGTEAFARVSWAERDLAAGGCVRSAERAVRGLAKTKLPSRVAAATARAAGCVNKNIDYSLSVIAIVIFCKAADTFTPRPHFL